MVFGATLYSTDATQSGTYRHYIDRVSRMMKSSTGGDISFTRIVSEH